MVIGLTEALMRQVRSFCEQRLPVGLCQSVSPGRDYLWCGGWSKRRTKSVAEGRSMGVEFLILTVYLTSPISTPASSTHVAQSSNPQRVQNHSSENSAVSHTSGG